MIRLAQTKQQSVMFLATCLFATQSLMGCGGVANTSNMPPVEESAKYSSQPATPAAHSGMSNGQKVVLLAGAAALYYMYKKNQEAHRNGDKSQAQYYLSKNGRVYYREQGGRVHWVTVPSAGIRVPADEASQYQNYQGVN